MINISINGIDYQVYNDWDIPLSKAIQLHEIVMGYPVELLNYYQSLIPKTGELEEDHQARISECKDKITIEQIYKTNPKHYGLAICSCSNIPQNVVDKILPVDRVVFYEQFIFKLAFGLYTGIADYKPTGIKRFEWKDQIYMLPETRTVMGADVPMIDEITLVFTEAADLLIQSSEMNNGKWDRAANIVSIICRPEGEEYDENTSLARVDKFKDLPMWIILEVFFCCIKPLITSQQSDLLSLLRAKNQEQTK